MEHQLKAKNANPHVISQPGFQLNGIDVDSSLGTEDIMTEFAAAATAAHPVPNSRLQNVRSTQNAASESNPEYSWELIGLGLEEPLPPQDMIDEM